MNKQNALKILDSCIKEMHSKSNNDIREIHKKVNRKIISARKKNDIDFINLATDVTFVNCINDYSINMTEFGEPIVIDNLHDVVYENTNGKTNLQSVSYDSDTHKTNINNEKDYPKAA
ncbi:hypothetical protein [Pectinatus frisingensis]|uniref:hypothetical protein n=1 Tax=Pectinatus frisingensis TaxID=865 RepID=UPI0018C50F34|nr:hypothetical protein [Pectinatus frisingensis]